MTLTQNKKTVLLILLAFAFSFSVRLIWVQQFAGAEEFKFNGEFMINTNDGYFYAEGARDILAGITESTNDLSPFESAGSILTAWIVKILPFSFETVIFYLPAFLGSLVVIPIVLIGREFGKIEVGFIAALIGSIAWSYYNRTMVGYYDTDMLNIVFPTLLLWSLIWAIGKNEDKYLLFAALDILAYRWWYPQSYSLEFAFFGLIGLFAIYQYIKKDDFKYTVTLLSFMMFAMMGLDGWLRLSIVVLLFIALKIQREIVEKYIYYILALSIVLFFATGGIDPILGQLKGYVFKDELLSSTTGLGVHFFSVMQTVREAGQIPFETFANRISGHTITFVLACIGYVWLAFKYRVMLLALPMVGLGFLALSGGLRFTIYAVPPMALGIAYLIYEGSKFLSKQFVNDTTSKVSYYVLLTIFTATAILPNIQHIQRYKIPTVFNAQEVKVLDQLKDIANREDYVVSWWDYGYPLRYYSDIKTLVDGGKHSGAVNFPVSFVLNSPQDVAAKMARLDVEYTEKRFTIRDNNKELDENDTKYIKIASSNIEQMTLDYGQNDTNKFLKVLNTDIKLPAKTRDVYLYLPNRMMNIFPTVALFSNINLMTGTKKARPFFYKSNTMQDSGNTIALGNNITILKNKGEIQIGKQTLKINNFCITEYDNKGILQKKIQIVDKNSPINVIYMKNYNQFLVLDNTMYNSTYIQLFVLENYDKNLYEPVILDPLAKIFKLKI
jgi:dolichyl-diphosphooligosaccharide--protein glycosyltransferase/undecaprenyl-diphosphooligosaccharide--protein glycosyltransferase